MGHTKTVEIVTYIVQIALVTSTYFPKVMKTAIPFIKENPFHCLHWSPLTDDVFVGLYCIQIGNVVRYVKACHLTKTTKRNNVDVVVVHIDDEPCALVVTERVENYRFSY